MNLIIKIRKPSFSPNSIILFPIRSFTEPPELKNSSFATTSQSRCWATLFILTIGVPPMWSSILSKMHSLLKFKFVLLVIEKKIIGSDLKRVHAWVPWSGGVVHAQTAIRRRRQARGLWLERLL